MHGPVVATRTFASGLADVRADFITWSFLFWIGQAVTVVGTVADLLVALR